MTDDEINDLWVRIIVTTNARTQVVAFARAIIAIERERCAKVAEDGRFLHAESPAAIFGRECAAAIRRQP